MSDAVTRIRAMAVSQDPTAVPTATSIVSILEVLIAAEPEIVAILPALFPGNAVIASAVALLPKLLPWLQRIEAALGQ